MRRLMIFCAVVGGAVSCAQAGDFEDEPLDFDRFYVESAATMVLPQGGARMPRRAGAALKAGWYFSEFWALEGEAAWLEDRVGLSAKALWHWWGYERLDPFFTVGAKGWLSDGGVGPVGGVGAFWHLTERCAVRVDADATLDIDGSAAMVYSLAAGLHFSF